MFKKLFAAAFLSVIASTAFALPFGSKSVLVVDDETGKILLEKNADAVVPIASLTKLMTAMVVLDANQDMEERIAIDRSDVDTLKHSSSRVPVGSVIARRDVLLLALMSSDNRAAASLGRTYPGGFPAFKAAVKNKIAALGMSNTVIEEPTGLSPRNRSTAADLVKMAQAAAKYPEITRLTTTTNDSVRLGSRDVGFRNTNRLVSAKGWDIGLSKTGYTREAGRCLIMSIKMAGKNATLVLLNAQTTSSRVLDAMNIRRFITGEKVQVQKVRKVAKRKTSAKSRKSIRIVKAKASGSKSKKRVSTRKRR
jgi:serine-type D-Ala-D-Ala endopeptidase (penicillin-binding protein 7)